MFVQACLQVRTQVCLHVVATGMSTGDAYVCFSDDRRLFFLIDEGVLSLFSHKSFLVFSWML